MSASINDHIHKIVGQTMSGLKKLERLVAQEHQSDAIALIDKDQYKYNGMFIMRLRPSDPHDSEDYPWQPIIQCSPEQLKELLQQLTDEIINQDISR